jgi:mono/diheme cytochrome c family protein
MSSPAHAGDPGNAGRKLLRDFTTLGFQRLLGATLSRGMTLLMCASLLTGWATTTFAQTAFTPRDESPEEFAAAPGREETFYTCTACHNFKLVAAQGLSRAGWDDSINLMVRRHNMPPPEPKERELLLNYLETAYPPRVPGRGGWQNPFSR